MQDYYRLLSPILKGRDSAMVAGEAEHFRTPDLNEPAFGRRQFAWDNAQDSA